jgi:hypothetical protein
MTVLWGDWHVDMFLNANLPTLLAPGNLPRFVQQVNCEYLIHTTFADAERMEASESFRQLRTLLKVTVKINRYAAVRNPIGMHHKAWAIGARLARRRNAFVLLMPPDVVWADGTFAALGAALEAGKKAIFMTYPRVVSESLVPEMRQRFPADGDSACSVPPKEMMTLAMRNLHPLMMAYLRDCPHFPIHAEMVMWPVPGDGFLLRLLARELFCYRPGEYSINRLSLLSEAPPDSEVHLFDDSMEFLGLSLTPLWKDVQWYLERRQLDPIDVARWWVLYDSPINNRLASRDLKFRCGNASEDAWQTASREASRLVAHLVMAREFLLIVDALDHAGATRAAEFVATALRVLGIARRWPHRGPFLIVAPSDAAFAAAGFSRIAGDGIRRADVLALLRACTIPLSHDAVPPPGATVVNLAGESVTLPSIAPTRVGINQFVVSEKLPTIALTH